MTPQFRTEPEASAELDEAALWYEQRRSGLGIEFSKLLIVPWRSSPAFPKQVLPFLVFSRTYLYVACLYEGSRSTSSILSYPTQSEFSRSPTTGDRLDTGGRER